MRGNQFITPAACVGLVLAFAALGQVRAVAQSESELYHDRWTKPFCMQPYWDEKKWENQNMRWDIQPANREMDMADAKESEHWHDRWAKPFHMQNAWDEQRIEEHMLNWHNQPVVTAVDLSGLPHSAHWRDQWNKPFNMQPAWDEQRWEDHCMNWNRPAEYRHKDSEDMDYRSE